MCLAGPSASNQTTSASKRPIEADTPVEEANNKRPKHGADLRECDVENMVPDVGQANPTTGPLGMLQPTNKIGTVAGSSVGTHFAEDDSAASAMGADERVMDSPSASAGHIQTVPLAVDDPQATTAPLPVRSVEESTAVDDDRQMVDPNLELPQLPFQTNNTPASMTEIINQYLEELDGDSCEVIDCTVSPSQTPTISGALLPLPADN